MKSTTKKLLLGILLTVCLTVLLALCAGAEDVAYSEGLKFTSNGDGTCYVSGIGTCTDTELNIPPVSPAGDSVTSIGYQAFYNCTSLTAITIPEGVTSIGDYAFSYCKSLTAITIPEGVTSIGNYAFRDCTSLTAITIPVGVTRIGSYAFYNCNSLTDVTIPEGVTSIGNYAFRECTSLTSITIPEGVTSIGSSAFRDCTSLTAITIPVGVTSIGSDAFYKCTSLTAITIPVGVTSIGNYAFSYCKSLTAITIPEGVTSIGSSAFRDCTSLTAITIPEGVTSIGSYTFGGCTSLTAITIPVGVTSIGNQAFYNCTSLTAITIPVGVTSIGSSAFRGCTSLTAITIPVGVTSIGSHTFEGCTSLTAITIPDGVTSIGYRAFYNCTVLTAITIPDSVTSIDDYAFCNCTSLTAITISEGVTSIGNRAFSGCTSLTAITIPDSVTSIGNWAFHNCTSLTAITIPVGVTSIGNWAFHNCTSLTDVYYNGTEAQWNEVVVFAYNDPLLNATIHFLGDAEVVSNTATCTEAGEITYECGCGSLHTYPHPALGHDMGEWYITTAPTCMTAGEERRDCQRDGCDHYETKTIEIDSSAHSLDWAYDDNQHWQYCTNKDKEGNQCAYVTAKENHVPGMWNIDKEVTCTEDGGKHTQCTVCNADMADVIPALGHDEIHHDAQAPTCENVGWYAYVTCSRCDYTTYKEIPALGHTEAVTPAIAPTCTETGLTEGKHCSVCGEILEEQQIVPANGHNYEMIHIPPTCTEEGLIIGICSVCGHESIVAGYFPKGHDYECVIIEYIQCMEGGKKVFTCSRCGDSYEELIPPTGHRNIEWLYYTQTNELMACCEWCGDILVQQEKAKFTGASYEWGQFLSVKYCVTIPRVPYCPDEIFEVMMRITYNDEVYWIEGFRDVISGEYIFESDQIPHARTARTIKAELCVVSWITVVDENGSYRSDFVVIAEEKTEGIGQYYEEAEVFDPTTNRWLDDNGTPAQGIVKCGDGELRYCIGGTPQRQGVVTGADGYVYYFNSSLKAVRGQTYAIGESMTNGFIPAGVYTVDEQGRLVDGRGELVRAETAMADGFKYFADGTIQYYVNGKAARVGLVADEEGNFYYFNSTLKAVRGTKYSFSSTMSNGLLPAGTYYFDETGKLILP